MFRRKQKKIEARLKANWGQAKSNFPAFELIEEYHHSRPEEETPYTLNEQTLKDLDFKLLFHQIDRTQSAIGQQYLYDRLCRLALDEAQLREQEKAVQQYASNEPHRVAVQKILDQLSGPNDYYFPFLLYGNLPPKMKQLWIVKGLQLFLPIGIFLCFYFPPFLLVLIFSSAINLFLHYWHKKRIGNFAQIFHRLTRLTHVGQQLLKQQVIPPQEQEALKASIKKINQITGKVLFLKTETLQENEFAAVAWYLFELFKIITLTEITTFHAVVDDIESSRKDIEQLYQLIGQVDTEISIANLRAGLPYYCLPEFTQAQKQLTFTGLYHPLVKGCVANDLQLVNKSLLLTGSNMSGKSTFIKAININAVVAQALNTAFAHTYQAPRLAIATSIRIADNIMDHKSYYMEEVSSIGTLLEKSDQSELQCLFTIDEVFKGTNTIERISAAKAILSYLNQGLHLVLVSTHDIELTQLLEQGYDLHYFQEHIEAETLSFDYRLRKGALQKRNAIKILELAAYPEEIIREAERLSEQLQSEKMS